MGLTNRLNLFGPSGPGARFELDGGNAFMPSLVISNAGDYLQRGGTNQVSGDLALYNAVSASQSSMGQLGLSANGTINLGSQPLVLRFADSSALNWDSSSLLLIQGWTRSYSGNDTNQIFVGNSSAGLTPAQLAQITFLDPAGSPPGYYSAQILYTGEVVPVVPVAAPTVQSSRFGNQLVLTWSGKFQLLTATNVLGPYQPVSGAASPYTNDIRKAPQRFFMLQGQ